MYTELHAHSYFSLLDGASSPEALVERAATLGMTALALTDHDGLYGAVRFWQAAHEQGIKPIIGAEATLESRHHLTLLAETQQGYANLSRLISLPHLSPIPNEQWPGKTPPRIPWEALNTHRRGIIALSGCRHGPVVAPLLAGNVQDAEQAAHRLYDIFGAHHLYIELQRALLEDDARLIKGLTAIARRLGVEVVATNNVHYATPDGQRLQDVMVCIRHLLTLEEAHRQGLLRPNNECYLKPSADMARLFAGLSEAITNTQRIAERCQVSLDFSGQRVPALSVPPGHTAFSHLYDLCQQGLHRKLHHVTPQASRQLARELDVIERTGLAGYFLMVHDIVRHAQQQGIRHQGRGSACNSLVAYLLDISPVDPLQHNLLFDRFLSEHTQTMPDIDIDFAADRRDEVIEYVYAKYGEQHTAMVCNVNTFRRRSALRDVGRTLGIAPEMLDRLIRERREPSHSNGQDDPAHTLLWDLCRQLEGTPRHLSIHVGGMLITAAPLTEVVPLERATMPGRVVTQWDKESVEDAGLIKLDILGLRTLGVVDEAVRLIEARTGQRLKLDRLPLDDPAIYDLLCKGDTIGTFQVESRAQISMLPRLRPRCFHDIVVAVAIIRPGPIQGNMTHPYLRRRQGLEPVSYPHPALEPVLSETLGVVLFQEQVLKVAMTIAGFSGGDADSLRRAMSRARSEAQMARLRERFIVGAQANGLDEATAGGIFEQLAAFSGYGFCKSHAAAFALLSYQTLWLKVYYPAEFTCAILNQQPMGFYSPSVIMGDAERHGVGVLHPSVNCSQDECTLEGQGVRLGLRYLHGFGPAARERVLDARKTGPFTSLPNLCHRTRLPRALIENLIRSGAVDDLCEGEAGRRRLLWELGALDYREDALDMATAVESAALPELTDPEIVDWELELLGMAPGDHPMRLHRPRLREAGVLSSADLNRCQNGDRVTVAGQVVIRQRPPTAKGHLFLSLEDETGLVNIIIRPDLYERRRKELHSFPYLVVKGRLQREGGASSVLAFDVSPLLA